MTHASRRVLLSGLALSLIAGVATVLLAPWQQPRQLPDIDVTVIHGRATSLSELRGRPLFVTFWSTTCGICMRERPLLAKLYRELGPSGLEIIAVAVSYDVPARVAAVIEREAIPFPVALDLDARAERAFGGIVATPTSFLFGPDGALVYRANGASDIEMLRQKVLQLLAEHPGATPGRART